MVSWLDSPELLEQRSREALGSLDELEPPEVGPLGVEDVEDADEPLALT